MQSDVKCIFHSDDFGFTGRITTRIAEAWNSGLLDGFSILANGNALKDAGTLLMENLDLDARLAVHLNLFEGRSLCPVKPVSLITDHEGHLNCTFEGLAINLLFGAKKRRRELLSQIEKEWRAQIEVVKDICAPRAIAAVDSHLHFHMLPPLFSLAARLCLEYGIPQIRISEEPFFVSDSLRDSMATGFMMNLAKHGVLRICSTHARRVARRFGLESPDALIGVLYTGRMTKPVVQAGLRAAVSRGARSIEVLFHIGRATEEELHCWDAPPRALRFPLSALRDVEYAELQRCRQEAP